MYDYFKIIFSENNVQIFSLEITTMEMLVVSYARIYSFRRWHQNGCDCRRRHSRLHNTADSSDNSRPMCGNATLESACQRLA